MMASLNSWVLIHYIGIYLLLINHLSISGSGHEIVKDLKGDYNSTDLTSVDSIDNLKQNKNQKISISASSSTTTTIPGTEKISNLIKNTNMSLLETSVEVEDGYFSFQSTSSLTNHNISELILLSSCCKLKPPQQKILDLDSKEIKYKFQSCEANLTSSYEKYVEAIARKSDDDYVWTIPSHLMSTNKITDFILQETPLYCRTDTSSSNIFYNSTKWWWLPNGYFRIDQEFYAPDEYCIKSFTEEGIQVQVCTNPDCGESRACIPKCCPLNKMYTMGMRGRRGCQLPTIKDLKDEGQNLLFNPQLNHDFHRKLTYHETKLSPKPHFYEWHPINFKSNCADNKTTIFPASEVMANMFTLNFKRTFNSVNFKIRKDGSFLYINAITKKCSAEKKPHESMCFDAVQDYGESEEGNLEKEIIVFLCSNWNVDEIQGHSNELIYGILMLTLSVFPLMTSAVYVALWAKQNVHGWTIAATNIALFFMYIFQGTAFAIAGIYGRGKLATWGCILIGIFGHFFILSSFSWLTVMCCDLWWTFRMLKPTNRRSKGISRYVKYSIFGWGIPTVYVSTGVILDYIHHKSKDCTIHTIPMYGDQSCWVTPSSMGVYVYYPEAALLSLNTFFFAVTCYKLCHYRKNTRFATKKETDHWRGFVRFSKLFLVMGCSFVFDVLAWGLDGLKLRWYWIIVDVINITRAIGIFIVYVCKQDILLMLEDTHPRLKQLFRRFKRRCSDDGYEECTASTVAGGSQIQMSNLRTGR